MPDFNNVHSIIEKLKSRPGEVLLHPDGTRLYALTTSPEGEDVLLLLDSETNLNEMSIEEVNQFIIEKLNSLNL